VRDTIQEFMRRGVVVRTVINGLTFDGATKDPMQQAVRDALIGFLAATAQANAEAIKEVQRGGIALAKAKDGETKYRGRKPSFTRAQFIPVRDMIAQSAGVGQIAKITGISRQTIYRIKDDSVAAGAALSSWAG
jgi:putative DNA-invertase from lambdoid prophage Rac